MMATKSTKKTICLDLKDFFIRRTSGSKENGYEHNADLTLWYVDFFLLIQFDTDNQLTQLSIIFFYHNLIVVLIKKKNT